MKTIYYLAISIPKSMASISSGEKCCSLKLPGVMRAEKQALERLKPRWWRPCPHTPGSLPDACLLFDGPAWRQRAANPSEPLVNLSCQSRADIWRWSRSPSEPLRGLSLLSTGQTRHFPTFFYGSGWRGQQAPWQTPGPQNLGHQLALAVLSTEK